MNQIMKENQISQENQMSQTYPAKLENIITQLADGTDPTTGEVIPEEAYKDPGVTVAIDKLKNHVSLALSGKHVSKNTLNRPTEKIYKDLKKWRKKKAFDSGKPAYLIFTDVNLKAIAGGDVVEKDDLLKIVGVGLAKMDLYGDEVYKILKPYIDGQKPSVEPATQEPATQEPATKKRVQPKVYDMSKLRTSSKKYAKEK